MTDPTLTQNHPTLVGFDELLERVPGLKRGGLRHALFVKGDALPGAYRFGRRWLFDPDEFISGVKAGATATIAGRERGAA